MKGLLGLYVLLMLFNRSLAQGIPGSNSSISIRYTYGMQKTGNVDIAANITGTADAVNGVAYNYGNAVSFTISSAQNYTVRISSKNENLYTGDLQNGIRDIRNFIFYSIADNNTGGIYYGPPMQALGSEEKTLLSGCPQTRTLQENPDDHYKTFSLLFWARPGYSIPPGNYTTPVVITATAE